MSFLPIVRLWLWLSILASVAGWALSAVGELNRAGYAVYGGVVVAGIWLIRKFDKRLFPPITARKRMWHWGKIRWRFRQGLPASFAALALLVFLGGALYGAGNHTALTYRIPRVLQWLSVGHWHWIHTPNYRMNDRACGIEWLSAPLLLFTKSGRGLFLINFIPFLLLPGLIFSVFTRLGVRSIVAWHWMWLLPTGYIFLLQGGSTANDTFPTVYALAAIDFGCRAWRSRRISDLWFSILSAALLTGAKASNLPLLLPWSILVFALVPLLKRRSALSLGVLLVAALVSFLPTAVLNVRYCGDWSGLQMENTGMDMKNPIVGIWGNTLIFILDNLVPPFFPAAAWWNQHALTLVPQVVIRPMIANFEQGFHLLWELPTEDWVGLGFGISLLLLASVLASWRIKARTRSTASPIVVPIDGDAVGRGPTGGTRPVTGQPSEIPRLLRFGVLAGAWVALLAYCVKSGMVTGARLIAPYYLLLAPALLIHSGQSEIIRRRWWRGLAWGVVLLSFPVLLFTPGRPLWPAHTMLTWVLAHNPDQRLANRALKVYDVYSRRPDPLASVRALLPPGADLVGFMATPDDTDISLWMPLFQRRVLHLLPTDTAEEIRRRSLRYAVVGGLNLVERGISLDRWLEQSKAQVVAMTNATVKVSEGSQSWYVVRFRD